MDATVDDGQTAKPFGLVGLCLSLVGLTLLACVLAALIAGAIVLLVSVTIGWPALQDGLRHVLAGSGETDALRVQFAGILCFYLGFAIAIFWAARWRGGPHWRIIIGWRPFALSDKLIWAVMLAALIYSACASDVAARFLHAAMQLPVPADPLAASMLFLLAVMLAPVTEEVLFRGWIYTSLRYYWGFWPALLITSVLFAGAHYEATHIYALAVFPIGLALGFIRERSGSVKTSMLFHAVNNFTAFALAALFAG